MTEMNEDGAVERLWAVVEPMVRRWRQKPVVVDAMQWTGGALPVIDWILSNGGTARHHDDNGYGVEEIEIDTVDATLFADPGDWIIRDARGEFHPCRPDNFAATYEPAGEWVWKEGGS